ncbi:hypothetical protein GALL_269770 [mine drainage metagenome]|uniref:Uncharacterized protein n=1 Tax=mine drainage metagenome TaxID=410659 RepID=A0A1J5RG86_9ZZZZ
MPLLPPMVTDSYIPPASRWIKFLRSYGPTPNNLSLFDEYVSGALSRTKVQPIKLSSPQLADMKSRILSGDSGSILIAGTAGDGKTYHCRSLWKSIGGSDSEWSSPSTIKEIKLTDGRMIIFVKDLSELTDEQSDRILELLENSVLNTENTTFLVIASNHGQILERMRDYGIRQNRIHPLRKPIQDTFLLSADAPKGLSIYDLSKAGQRKSLEEILSAIAGHPEWENCTTCKLQSEKLICPIFENRNRILGKNDEGGFSKRLGDLVEVAKFNGWHLPIRDLLALVTNIILGHSEAREGLMGCSDVARIQNKGSIELGSLYGNVFGANLPRRRAIGLPVFRALASFGVGEETTNGSDGLLVYGKDDSKLSEAFSRLISSDQVYGATPNYLSSQLRYLEGEEDARLDAGSEEFLDRLTSQRRRLFFTLPEKETNYTFWSMTAFKFAGYYLKLAEALETRNQIDENVRTMLVKGLNRVMSGLLLDNNDRIFIASSGGFTQSKVSVLCDTETPSRRSGNGGLAIKQNPQTKRPTLDIVLSHNTQDPVSFDLSPVRFEFLCRVAEGSLPGSFSNECLEDMLAFKAKLLRKAEILRSVIVPNEEELNSSENLLTLNFIEIEQNGHGFSRPVIIRMGV